MEGQSMAPNFQSGQLVKFEMVPALELRRRDVIVFHFPAGPVKSDGCFRDFVKRIIGLPGELVEIRQGVVLIGGVKLDEPYLSRSNLRGSMECIPSLEVARCVLQEDQYFVLGDNRDSSNDSRDWRPLPLENIVGRVLTQPQKP